jgi:hypothetical protein
MAAYRCNGRKVSGVTYHRRDDCRLCGSRNVGVVLRYAPQPLPDQYLRTRLYQPCYAMDLYQCEDCGAVQLLDVVSPETIYPDYSYKTSSSAGLVEHFNRYADQVTMKLMPQLNDLVVDIGSNDGVLLKAFRKRGLRVVGVEPAQAIAEATSIQDGIPTFPMFFDADCACKIRAQHGAAQIITANNVFANIDDLVSFMLAVRDLLAFDGVFVFETFYLADMIDNLVFDFIYHEHLNAFAVQSLKKFFDAFGMELFDVDRVPTKGGSIRCFVRHKGGFRRRMKAVDDLVQWELTRGLDTPIPFITFAKRIEIAKNEMYAKLDKYDGNAVGAGYGASPTSTTLIYQWDLGKRLDYLVDDWDVKQETFSPGLHLPVKSPEQLDADYCIILAWRYAEQIKAKHPEYRGQWIVPVTC